MRKLKIMSVGGARPNFMKLAPFVRELGKYPLLFEHFLVHTGQHYDANMSDSFFRELRIPQPDANLGIGSGSHAEQVGRTMIEFEGVVGKWKPDWIVVVGDVNATCACSLTAAKETTKLAHIEAGLRSFDRAMPEEINRIVTDRLSDLLFTPDEIADANLRREGAAPEKIRRVGNIMIDTLEENRKRAARLDVGKIVTANLSDESSRVRRAIPKTDFAVLTLHRPSNVDNGEVLRSLAEYFASDLSATLPLFWILHPRTRKQLEKAGIWNRLVKTRGVFILRPIGYREMLRLNMAARVMFTDSGGLQEECCVVGTPCVTLRDNTERPVTLRENGGVSLLAGNDIGRIRKAFKETANMPRREFRPPMWDGHTAERIVEAFAELQAK